MDVLLTKMPINIQASVITEPEKLNHNSQLPSDRTLNARNRGCWDEQTPQLRKIAIAYCSLSYY